MLFEGIKIFLISSVVMSLTDLAHIGSHNKREKQSYKSNLNIKLGLSNYNIELVTLAEKYVKCFYNIIKNYREDKRKVNRQNAKIEKRSLMKC